MSFFGKVREALRVKARDKFYAGLQSLGIEASMAPRGRREEHVKRADRARSLGLIDIPDGVVRWVNVQDFSGPEDTYYCATYGVPDPKITPTFPNMSVKSTRVRSPWALGGVAGVDWKGTDIGLEVIDRLVGYQSEELMRMLVDVEIKAHPEYGCWAISPLGYWRPNELLRDQGLFGGLPSLELWGCYQAIGLLLLST